MFCHRPHDPECPVACQDKTFRRLIAERHAPIPAKPGHAARHDYEYERDGTANLFMFSGPLESRRHVAVTDRRTGLDYARILKDLSGTHLPEVREIVLARENLNTPRPESLYETFVSSLFGMGSNNPILSCQSVSLFG